jgi:electron-transferring-flavoprotein dehydrogenase
VRNYHPSFHAFGGLYGWMAYSAAQAYLFRGFEPWTFRNKLADHQRTKPAKECTKIVYPKPDGIFTFDILTNLQRSAVKHNDQQPSHLRVRPEKADTPITVSHAIYDSPETRFCPARVYEVHVDEADPSKTKLQINNTNCVHCKSCAIKTPELYIDWTVPEGGGGPNYQGM